MGKRDVFIIVVAAAVFSPALAEAIIRRHDVPDARYLAMGEAFRNTVGRVRLPVTGKEGAEAHGVGTLVGDTWVLTAAHVARHYRPAAAPDDRRAGSVEFNGVRYPVASVVMHPRYQDGVAAHDMALIRLASPVAKGSPACLYDRSDEAGKVTILAGSGFPGDGLTGVAGREPTPRLRAATVHIDAAQGSELSWRFHPAPDHPLVTPMEGISGPSDSGGPAFLRKGETLCVAGVSSQQTNNGREGVYGVLEQYARVSAQRSWLRSVMAAG